MIKVKTPFGIGFAKDEKDYRDMMMFIKGAKAAFEFMNSMPVPIDDSDDVDDDDFDDDEIDDVNEIEESDFCQNNINTSCTRSLSLY